MPNSIYISEIITFLFHHYVGVTVVVQTATARLRRLAFERVSTRQAVKITKLVVQFLLEKEWKF